MRVERLDPLSAVHRDSRAADVVDDDGMPGLCQGGEPHRFDGVECSWCGTEPYAPDSERPAGWYVEPYPGHVCFDGCRHRH
jgi:hypothetical protein